MNTVGFTTTGALLRKTECGKWFGRLNTLRNLIAHPLKRELTDEEQTFLLDCDQKASAITARLEQFEFQAE